MPGAVEDCQGVYDERRRNSGQEKKQQQKLTEVGRPDRSTDMHEVHQVTPVDRTGRPARMSAGYRALGWIPVDRTGRPERSSVSNPTLCLFRSTGSVDRKRESVDRSGRPTVGFWAKSAVSGNYVFKPWL